MFAAQYYKFIKPNRWINYGGLGTMGVGFPAAMGVKLSFPDSDVACVTGEGSIQMNIQELSTCLQYGLPVKIVHLNNGVLGLVRQDRKSVVQGKSVSVRVDLGGGRLTQKQKRKTLTTLHDQDYTVSR